MSVLAQHLEEESSRLTESFAQGLLGSLIQETQYVGEVYSLGYESALVQIHDFYRQKVGGIPSLSLLIATRLAPEGAVKFEEENASIILLRVMDAAALPNDQEANRIRVESAQRVSGELDTHWDTAAAMDEQTANLLSFAGVKCRVIGTFFLEQSKAEADVPLTLKFGSDISNYYPNLGLKVYKPNADALRRIVNYRDLDRVEPDSHPVNVGHVRYASTNRSFQGISEVPVDMVPEDLLGQKTALFGMTRTGKSNTTKIILQSVFNLRFAENKSRRIGQIVFDPNGEYANENTQDGDKSNPNAIKNVWKSTRTGVRDDVITYGITSHPNDPGRRLMLLNFFEDRNLQVGKEIIDAALAADNSIYIRNFRQVSFDTPSGSNPSAMRRCLRRALVYRTLLVKAGFAPPSNLRPSMSSQFNQQLLQSLANSSAPDPTDHISASRVLGNRGATWEQLGTAFVALADFINHPDYGYSAFNQVYISRPGGSGDSWADEDLKKLLEMFRYSNGPRLIGQVRDQHTDSTTTDYVVDIYEALAEGKLVVIDQSSGDALINQGAADRVMWYIFRENQSLFRNGRDMPEILVYIEEAHNVLPSDAEKDMQNIWVRTAKEGAKYHIGMVYATQEVSTIQKNILKNTSNWFIGHLNNTDETKELCKYYDFADFEASIRRAQDRGFVRVKTLSNLFVVPVQVRKFEVPANAI